MFSFHLYYFSFYLSFRLVRKLAFLYVNVNVYLMEIPCLNKVTLPLPLPLFSASLLINLIDNLRAHTVYAVGEGLVGTSEHRTIKAQ